MSSEQVESGLGSFIHSIIPDQFHVDPYRSEVTPNASLQRAPRSFHDYKDMFRAQEVAPEQEENAAPQVGAEVNENNGPDRNEAEVNENNEPGGNEAEEVITPVDEEGEQYETYFLNVVDEADLLAAAEAAGVEQAVCSCSEKCEVGAVNTECAVCSVNMGKCVGVAPEPAETEEPAEEPETGGSMGRLLLILAVAGIGGGAAFYFKVIRPKQQQAAEPEEDYGEEDYEDDGPPWDEDENSEEDEE